MSLALIKSHQQVTETLLDLYTYISEGVSGVSFMYLYYTTVSGTLIFAVFAGSSRTVLGAIIQCEFRGRDRRLDVD